MSAYFTFNLILFFAACSAVILLLLLAAQHGFLDSGLGRGHQRGHLAAARRQGQTLRALRAGKTST